MGRKIDKVLRNRAELIGFIEGGSGSRIDLIARNIEENIYNYPYSFEYRYFPGPNSNTFTQWIIDNFRISHIKLPWNAFGKNYPSVTNIKD